MARPAGPKTRNSGNWTEARFKTFIKSALRSASRKWGPINECKKEARVSRGVYECSGCGQHVPATVKVGMKRVKNIFVDHIEPITDPTVGFVSWDETIERMFCEKDNLQLLCGQCHDEKTMEERAMAKERREKEKQ